MIDMKKILLTLCLLLPTLFASAQINRQVVLYAEKNGNMLYLYMNPEEYSTLQDHKKSELISVEAEAQQVSTVYVINNHQGELWHEQSHGHFWMVDSWDKDQLSEMTTIKGLAQRPERSLKHPWFFNVSGALTTMKEMYYLNLYGRLGFFLMKGRWDFAMNTLLGYSKPRGTETNTKGTFNNSIGFDTRVYFPIRPVNVNPFVGVGMSYAFGGGEKSVVFPVSAGVNIPLWKGCFDACWQYDKLNKHVFVIGYTFMFK